MNANMTQTKGTLICSKELILLTSSFQTIETALQTIQTDLNNAPCQGTLRTLKDIASNAMRSSPGQIRIAVKTFMMAIH